MFLVNLTLAEFLAIFGAVSGLVVMIYLLDRSRRRVGVATLRFWVPSERPLDKRHRRKIQQPWSLLLQLIAIALLTLALAQLRLGSPDRTARDHVIILDTSAWMAARSRQGTLLEEARAAAKSYVRALPGGDRAMLVRADALATPATGFESDRNKLIAAIDKSQPGHTALHLTQAFELARRIQQMHSNRAGEIVFAGSGRIAAHDTAPPANIPNLRVLPVSSGIDNCGIRKIGLRRSTHDPDVWEIYVSARNYGSTPRTVPLSLSFGGAPAGARNLTLPPNGEQSATFEYRTRAAGWAEARLLTKDALPEDDRAMLEAPAENVIRVTIYSDEPDSLRPILSANPRVEAIYLAPAEYRPVGNGIVVLDRFRPPVLPEGDAIWIEPPASGSPVPVRTTVTGASLSRWRSDHPLGAGLRNKDVRLDTTQIFASAKGDIHVAELDAGPAILARSAKHKLVILGFHPARSALRYELATPLLFANILRWMSPGMFRRWDLNLGSAGSVNVTLDSDVEPSTVRVLSDQRRSLPFTLQGKVLRFFEATPGTVRVMAGNRELVYSLTLPEIAEVQWQAPANARRGVPPRALSQAAARDLWQWLALAAAVVIILDWVLFGRIRIIRRAALATRSRPPLRRAS
jgi:hypothetical protein